jgi:DNA polymerase III subunit delta'
MPLGDTIGHRRQLLLLSRAIGRGSFPPSLVLGGPEGIGKLRVARSIAQSLNCLEPVVVGGVDACGRCSACRRIQRGIHPDVLVLKPDESGAIKIDEVREAIDKAAYRPFEGRRRVVIMEEADAMMVPAQNALLKTLEEPPPASVFLLVTARPDSLLPTVQSRCPRLRFGRLTNGEVVEVLMRDHGYEEDTARAVASLADGSPGRALLAGSAEVVQAREVAGKILAETAQGRDAKARLDCAKALLGGGKARRERDMVAVRLRALASLIRDLGVLTARAHDRTLANLDMKAELEGLSRSYDGDRIVRAFSAVNEALRALERNASPKVVADWLVLQV